MFRQRQIKNATASWPITQRDESVKSNLTFRGTTLFHSLKNALFDANTSYLCNGSSRLPLLKIFQGNRSVASSTGLLQCLAPTDISLKAKGTAYYSTSMRFLFNYYLLYYILSLLSRETANFVKFFLKIVTKPRRYLVFFKTIHHAIPNYCISQDRVFTIKAFPVRGGLLSYAVPPFMLNSDAGYIFVFILSYKFLK